VCVSVCKSVCVCAYVYMYVWVCVMCVCMYVVEGVHVHERGNTSERETQNPDRFQLHETVCERQRQSICESERDEGTTKNRPTCLRTRFLVPSSCSICKSVTSSSMPLTNLSCASSYLHAAAAFCAAATILSPGSYRSIARVLALRSLPKTLKLPLIKSSRVTAAVYWCNPILDEQEQVCVRASSRS